ncbi:SCO4225 family membrane protein [Streptomyces sp. NPDC003362]
MRSARHLAARYSRGDTALLVACGYATVVLGVTAWLQSLVLFGDPGFGGVWLIAVTLPISVPLLAVPAPAETFALVLAAGGLVQAWALWRLLRGKRLG